MVYLLRSFCNIHSHFSTYIANLPHRGNFIFVSSIFLVERVWHAMLVVVSSLLSLVSLQLQSTAVAIELCCIFFTHIQRKKFTFQGVLILMRQQAIRFLQVMHTVLQCPSMHCAVPSGAFFLKRFLWTSSRGTPNSSLAYIY